MSADAQPNPKQRANVAYPPEPPIGRDKAAVGALVSAKACAAADGFLQSSRCRFQELLAGSDMGRNRSSSAWKNIGSSEMIPAPSRSDSPLETSGSFSAWCVEIGPARISTMESPHVMGANVSSGEPSRVDCRTPVDSTGAALSQQVSLDHTKAQRVATDSSVRVTISRNNGS